MLHIAGGAKNERAEFASAVTNGLRHRPRAIPSRFLYDAHGSLLFDQICESPSYYLARAEAHILREMADEIARLAGPGVVLIEYGSGSSFKTRLLIDAMQDLRGYVPIDVSREHLEAVATRLRREHPGLSVAPLYADYMEPLLLPDSINPQARRLGFFTGSTIGNMVPAVASAFLLGARKFLGNAGALVLGVDLRKDPARLNAAYNDPTGASARFNLNLLTRMNRELGANFDLPSFAYEAFYNPNEHRIEIFLRSLRPQTVIVDGESFVFSEGERINTEYSYKYDATSLAALAEAGGFRVSAFWTDPNGQFAVAYLDAI